MGNSSWIIVTYLLSLYPGIPIWDDSHSVYIYACRGRSFVTTGYQSTFLPAKFLRKSIYWLSKLYAKGHYNEMMYAHERIFSEHRVSCGDSACYDNVRVETLQFSEFYVLWLLFLVKSHMYRQNGIANISPSRSSCN
jgi:hypothetical protein